MTRVKRGLAARVTAAVAVLGVLAGLVGCGGGTHHAAGSGATGGTGGAGGCPPRVASDGRLPFSSSSLWNAPVAPAAALDPASPQLVAQLATELQSEISRRSGPWINIGEFSVPVYRVASCQPTVRVHLDNPHDPALAQAFSAVPVPAYATPAKGTDSLMVVYQPSSDRLWEFWEMHRAADGWHATWGGAMNGVSSNPGYFQGPGPSRGWGAAASGLAELGGLITPEDLRKGSIDHALAIALPDVRAGQFAFPAQRTDGKVAPPNGIPEGAHLRLDPNLDLSTLHLTPIGLEIARAAQRYGLVVRDFSTNLVFLAEDPRGLGSDPWPQLLNNATPFDILAGFPWDRLQLLRMQLA